MKQVTLLSASFMLFFAAKSQYDVDIKPKETGLSKKQEAALEMEKVGHCQFVPLVKYKEGMKFYFPKDDYREKETDDVLYYYLSKEEKKTDYNRTKIPYKDLSGKVFQIVKFEEKEANYSKKGVITLKDVNSDYSIQYQTAVPVELLKDKLESGSTTFNLSYAIYTADVDSFKSAYLGKELFTRFKVNGKKNEKVKIIQVGAGSEDAPIRIVFETATGAKDQKDICTCGTNVPGDMGELYRFLDFFSFENPRDQYKGPDAIWELICEERVRIGMSEEEVLLSRGKPKKISQTIVEGKNTKQFIYSKGYVYIDNGIVTGLQNN
jgi:hypothetical protein